ncbi:hypothetical protein JTP77_011940 [Streptomyces sp. S9]|nr:hypothetical protein [Streptomyces sp. S9]
MLAASTAPALGCLVREVCFAVGLASLDTFTTTRSTELVGMPPGADTRP